MSLLIADVSEFQGAIDMAAYANENPAIIIRAHNGRRADYQWNRNITAASTDPKIRWIGAYQYLPANVGAGLAAQRFLDTLGPHRPNITILDLEEGDGDQQARQHAWLTVMADDPTYDWTYSGDYFARTHGLTVDWIAAYQNREPTLAHTLWQFTDKQYFDGIGPCDGSKFHGTVADLIALTSGTPPEDDLYTQDDRDLLQKIANALFDDKNGMQGRLARVEASLGRSDPANGVDEGIAGAVHLARVAVKDVGSDVKSIRSKLDA